MGLEPQALLFLLLHTWAGSKEMDPHRKIFKFALLLVVGRHRNLRNRSSRRGKMIKKGHEPKIKNF